MNTFTQNTEVYLHAVDTNCGFFHEMLSDLSPADVQESEAMIPGMVSMRLHDAVNTSVYLKGSSAVEGGVTYPLCMFGVQHVKDNVWAPWYVQSRWADGSYTFAKVLLRSAPSYLNTMVAMVWLEHMKMGIKASPILENYVWSESDTAMAFCKKLGFDIGPAETAGTEGNTFHRVRMTF